MGDKPTLLTVRQTAEAVGLSIRTIRAYMADGLPSVADPTWADKRMPRRLLDLDQTAEWIRRHKGRKVRVRKLKERKPLVLAPVEDPPAASPVDESPAGADPGAEAEDEPEPIEAEDPGAVVREARRARASTIRPDDVLAMRDRLSKAEQIAHKQYQQAQALLRRDADNATFEKLAKAYQAQWKDLCTERRLLEKELPDILYRQSRFVDVEEVGQLITRAVAGMCSELDQAGIRCAARHVEMTSAKAVRTVVDEIVREARRHIEAGLEDLCRSE